LEEENRTDEKKKKKVSIRKKVIPGSGMGLGSQGQRGFGIGELRTTKKGSGKSESHNKGNSLVRTTEGSIVKKMTPMGVEYNGRQVGINSGFFCSDRG